MKKNLSLLLLMCAGIGIGVGISEISKHLHTQDFIPNQYSPNVQDSQNLGENAQNLTQDSIDLNKSQSLELPENATSLAQDDSLNTPQTENPDTLFAPQDSRDSTMVIVQDIFSQERQIPQFQEYPTNIYQGQFMSADESCVNCQGGPQEALKRGIIDFGGKYALYRLKPNNDEIIIGAVNVENGEVQVTTTSSSLFISNTGIAPLDDRKLFQRFYRGKSDKKDSTGLGLAIAQTIARSASLTLSYRWKEGMHCFILS